MLRSMRRTRAAAAGIVFLVLAFAGCTDRAVEPVPLPEAPDDVVVATVAGPKVASELTAADQVEAPAWRVGQWFGVHVWRSGGDTAGRHYNVVVVEQTQEHWVLAPDDRQAALEDAAYDLPVVGAFSRDSLATTGYGLDWDLYEFPLYDGATWDRAVSVREPTRWELRTHEVTFTARFEDQIDVSGTPRAGFVITGVLDNGTVLVETDYVPSIGWYAHLALHVPETAATDDHFFLARSMGAGGTWQGVYHVAEATPVLDRWQWFIGFAPQESQPHTGEGFQVPADAMTLYGFVVSFAYAGTHDTMLVAPDGEVRRQHAVHAGIDAGGDVVRVTLDEPARPGDWVLGLAGAGVVFGGGAVLWAMQETEVPFPGA